MSAEAVGRMCSAKKVFLEILQNSPENTCARVSFLIKLQARGPRPEACNFIKKETLAQVFSCELCEISKNTFSYGKSPVDASAIGVFLWDRPFHLNLINYDFEKNPKNLRQCKSIFSLIVEQTFTSSAN